MQAEADAAISQKITVVWLLLVMCRWLLFQTGILKQKKQLKCKENKHQLTCIESLQWAPWFPYTARFSSMLSGSLFSACSTRLGYSLLCPMVKSCDDCRYIYCWVMGMHVCIIIHKLLQTSCPLLSEWVILDIHFRI